MLHLFDFWYEMDFVYLINGLNDFSESRLIVYFDVIFLLDLFYIF